MLLSEVLREINVLCEYTDCEIVSLRDDSRKIENGFAYVCIKGNSFDGHDFAGEMLAKGAAAVITERDLGLERQVIVEDTRKSYAKMCAAFFGYPARKLKLIGITGTNGKSSTAFFIKGILEHLGVKAGLLGSVKNLIGDEEFEVFNTTPTAFELQEFFAKMVLAQCEYCVMEVASQALSQYRVEGVHFDAAIFTNLTQDHLDYHGNMENYKQAKSMLFKNCSLAILNADDTASLDMIRECDCRSVTYSKSKSNATYMAKNINLSDKTIEYELLSDNTIGRVHMNIPGEFNVYNSMAAIIALVELGFDFHKCRKAISTVPGVCGRIELVPTETDYSVIIDSAHTPDALENIISALKGICRGKLITVFGCGGDRDSTKRPIMGALVSELSDKAIVTSDNPRSENPETIINDILAGIRDENRGKCIIEADRTAAITLALSLAEAGDIVLLAGKGQETYQIMNSGKIHFDEREKVKEILAP